MNVPETIAAAVAGTLALTRATRLVVDDDYPPVLALKRWLVARLPADWVDVVDCPWCASPYLAAPAVAWFATRIAFPTNLLNNYAWWLVNGWAAVSWLAAYLTVRDIPPEARR